MRALNRTAVAEEIQISTDAAMRCQQDIGLGARSPPLEKCHFGFEEIRPEATTPLRSSCEVQTENDFAMVFIGSRSLSLSSGNSMKPYFR
jgi:hypothetical protein